MKTKFSLLACCVGLLFIANSCAPSTPATRIEKNPAMFQNLSTSDKQLAQLGQVERGMHKDGVLLAWGKPHGVSFGSRSGTSFEKWIYTTSSPVYTSSLQPFIACGYGRFGSRSCYQGFEFGPELHYVQRTSAEVEFGSNHKVSEWMKLK